MFPDHYERQYAVNSYRHEHNGAVDYSQRNESVGYKKLLRSLSRGFDLKITDTMKNVIKGMK